MRILVLALILCPVLLKAQETEIKWSTSESWDNVLAEAKAENKYIFLDAFATWCKPCKMMDRRVYTSPEVVKLVNGNFIPVRLQIDSTRNDGEPVRKWYNDAKKLQNQFQIVLFPSFIFLSPSGVVVHRDAGYIEVHDFTLLLNDALDKNKQLYTLIANYKIGKKDYSSMPTLLQKVKYAGETTLAESMKNDYIQNFLLKQKDEIIFTDGNLSMIGESIVDTSSQAFHFFLSHSKKIDQRMNEKGYTAKILAKVIVLEEINPCLWNGKSPTLTEQDWKMFESKIAQKYGKEIARRAILISKIRWYQHKKNWPEVVKNSIEKVEQFGVDTSGIESAYLNNMIYDIIFKHSEDKGALQKGCSWMKMILSNYPSDQDYLDTYANLLYKLGKKEEAIRIEKKAVEVSSQDPAVLATLKKMEEGKITW